MTKIISILLKHYDIHNPELYLKAKFLLGTTLVAIIGLSATLSYTSYTFGIDSTTVIVESLGLMIMICALAFLVKGRYFLAGHIILVSGFCVAWIILFTEPLSSILIKLDTIVFILVLMAVIPLMFFKNRNPLLVYSLLNFGLFGIFIFYLYKADVLTQREFVDYALDNTVAMLFILVISYNLFTIYHQALNSLKKELSEKKRAESSLNEFRIFLTSIINSMPSMIIGVDNSRNIVLWNMETTTATGMAMDSVVGDNLFDVLPQLGFLDPHLKKVKQSKTVSQLHKQYISLKEKKYSLAIAVYPLMGEDLEGAVIRLDDISERLKMEEMMIQSEKMLSLGGLAAGMAHEINNPLAGMMQNAQLALNRVSNQHPANEKAAQELGIQFNDIKAYLEKREVIHSLELIKKSGRNAADIVKNMLSFARESDSQKQPENLDNILNKAVEMTNNDWDIHHTYDFKSVKIIKNFQPGLPPVLCEKSKIQQVLFNILKNASEAMSDDKTKQGSAVLKLSLSKTKGMARVEIEDNGPGMDDEIRKRIFEPFYTTKGVDKGTGLGLSVSYFIIVDEHGGELEVQSSLGKGTKFIIQLPFNPV